jgi:hypothetical protein
MYEKQHTLTQPVTVTGRGLHTGAAATMTFNPAPEHHGYVFRRVDLPGTPTIRADVDLVVDTRRGTTIEENGARVHTVEHTLAALAGLQIDNCLIDLDGPEPPNTSSRPCFPPGCWSKRLTVSFLSSTSPSITTRMTARSTSRPCPWTTSGSRS